MLSIPHQFAGTVTPNVQSAHLHVFSDNPNGPNTVLSALRMMQNFLKAPALLSS